MLEISPRDTEGEVLRSLNGSDGVEAISEQN